MTRVKKLLLVLLCCLAGVVAAVAVWCFSPGPDWMAERTAWRYLEDYAPEYTEDAADLLVFPGEVKLLVLPLVYIKYPSYTVMVKREANDRDYAIVMELLEGPFPLSVTEVRRTEDGKLVVCE